MQTTLIILKPDAIQRGLIGRIISRFEDKGLIVIGAKFMRVTRELAEEHYAEHKGKGFYGDLVNFITSTPVLVMAIHGKEAVAVCRKLIGKTVGYEADPGTIRGDFGSSKSFNLIHGSDSESSAERELNLFFQEAELCPYDRVIAQWVVDTSSGEAE